MGRLTRRTPRWSQPSHHLHRPASWIDFLPSGTVPSAICWYCRRGHTSAVQLRASVSRASRLASWRFALQESTTVVSRALTNQRLAVLARIDLSDACESGLARHEACESFQLSTRVMRSIVEICATGRASRRTIPIR